MFSAPEGRISDSGRTPDGSQSESVAPREASGMREIVVFNDKERIAVEKSLSFAAKRNPDYYRCLYTTKNALETLAHSISQYPSIMGTQKLRKKFRSVDSLVHSLCNSNANDRVLQTPTRAVLGKGFLMKSCACSEARWPVHP